jgi:hypothetical protein
MRQEAPLTASAGFKDFSATSTAVPGPVPGPTPPTPSPSKEASEAVSSEKLTLLQLVNKKINTPKTKPTLLSPEQLVTFIFVPSLTSQNKKSIFLF